MTTLGLLHSGREDDTQMKIGIDLASGPDQSVEVEEKWYGNVGFRRTNNGPWERIETSYWHGQRSFVKMTIGEWPWP